MIESKYRGWRLIERQELPQEVLVELEKECPDVDVLRKWCFAKYSKEINALFNPARANQSELIDFAQWLNFQRMEGDACLHNRKWPRLQEVLFSTFASKVLSIAQRHCFLCAGGRPIEDQFPTRLIPLRIRPISRQATKDELFKAFQAAVQSYFERMPMSFDLPEKLCLSLTFVLSSTGRDKDVDNMAKAMQDAIARALSFDDRAILHLDVMKLIFSQNEEHAYARLAPSYINDHSDVLAPIFGHDWAGQPELNLADFLNEKSR